MFSNPATSLTVSCICSQCPTCKTHFGHLWTNCKECPRMSSFANRSSRGNGALTLGRARPPHLSSAIRYLLLPPVTHHPPKHCNSRKRCTNQNICSLVAANDWPSFRSVVIGPSEALRGLCVNPFRKPVECFNRTLIGYYICDSLKKFHVWLPCLSYPIDIF